MLVPLVGLAMIVIAVAVLHAVTRDVHLSHIRAALATITADQVALALLFTALSFAALSCFDVLAVRSVAPGAVPWWKAALAGGLGFSVSNVLGFGILTGSAMRYRIYSAEGLDGADILRIIASSYMAFWAGFALLLGLALLFDPTDVELLRALGAPAEEIVGVAILAAIALLLAWIGPAPRALNVRGWPITLPTRSVAIGQTVTGALDMAASAAVLYVLLPSDAVPALAAFLFIFAGAHLLGIASHAPGGLGVFEATIVAALGAEHSAELIAALLVYRLIYYAVPFALGVAGLAGYELTRHRERLSATAAETRRLLSPIVPIAAAAAVCMAGLALLFASALPIAKGRLAPLQTVVPLPLAEMSHLVGSVAGIALLIVARGLLRRYYVAWLITLALLAVGAAAALLKSLDLETTLVLAAVAAVLLAFRDAFHRRRNVSELRLTPAWLAMVLAAAVSAGWLGFFSYRHVEYSHELWWQFAWAGDAPRFMRASVGVAAVIVCATVWMLVSQPFWKPFRPDPVPDAVRRLVSASPQTQPNVALLGDKKFLFAPDESAFLMYGRAGRSFVAMGDPVGSSNGGAELIWRFRELADESGARAIYYAVSSAYLAGFLDMGLSILRIGEVARVDLLSFSLEGKKRQDFRYADRRAEKEGLSFEVVQKAEVPRHIGELKEVSDAWLALKSGHEKGFSLGSFSPGYLAEFDCAVLRDAKGIVAFANLWRSGGGEEMSVDLMRYRPHESKVLMDALFARLLLYAKAEGYRWFNLGAAPLAGLKQHPLASSWNRIGSLLYRHGEDFYHFEGLRAFKQKFEPVWSPQYIAGRGGLALPGVLYDITTLISGGRLGILTK